MPILGVIFDLGHTLMHLNSTWPEVFAQGVTDLAAYLDERELGPDGQAFAQALLKERSEGFARAKTTHCEVTARETMRRTFARFDLNDPEPVLVDGAIDAFFTYEFDCWYADPEALPVLQELAGWGLWLGMFSNASDDRFIQRLVDGFGFRPWLEPSLSSAGTGIRKPDPAAFVPLLSAWDLGPESVVMVGDTLEADILGANRAGMHSVWIRSREDARQEGGSTGGMGGATPDATIERLGELPGQLAGM